MKIGELAERSGIPTSTIRYYEREGLLRLDLIQLGQRLGFSLDAIRTVMALQGDALKDALLDKLETRLEEIDRLRAVLDEQRRSVVEAKERVQAARDQGECRVEAAWAS